MTRRHAAAVVAGALIAGACSLPPVDLEGQKPLALRSTITSANGSRLARLFKENRGLTSIDVVPRFMLDAVLAAEDSRFFSHDGYDVRSIIRAALVNWRTGDVAQGGSTITQQYVKNTFFREPGQTFERKARELRLAVEVEHRYSKREILERYLNTVYFGDGAYGIRAAAETFFGHGVARLSLTESALLAAVIKSPASYDPRDHPRLARERRDYVLGRMADLSFVGTDRSLRAQRRPLGAVAQPSPWATQQPYFIEAVKREVLEEPRLGATPLERERALWKGGLRIRSTLQPKLQKAAQAAASSVLTEPGDPEELQKVLPTVTSTPGFWTREEFMRHYAGRSGRDLSDMHWHMVFAYFKLAVILQQIYARWKKGQTKDERFATFGERVENLILHAERLSRTGDL